MQPDTTTKVQQPTERRVCPVCRGTKQVVGRGGVVLTCHQCRGTGQAPAGGMQTK